jgi:transcriptional regulator with XRE-family HTH domain
MPALSSASVRSHDVWVSLYAEEMSTLADRIRLIRNETGLTLEALGKIAGVKTQSVQQWENGETKNIRNEPLFRLQRRLGYSAEWIAIGEGSKKLRSHDDPTNYLDLNDLTQEQRVSLCALLDAFKKSGDKNSKAC